MLPFSVPVCLPACLPACLPFCLPSWRVATSRCTMTAAAEGKVGKKEGARAVHPQLLNQYYEERISSSTFSTTSIFGLFFSFRKDLPSQKWDDIDSVGEEVLQYGNQAQFN
jgi:hypothetical protein